MEFRKATCMFRIKIGEFKMVDERADGIVVGSRNKNEMKSLCCSAGAEKAPPPSSAGS